MQFSRSFARWFPPPHVVLPRAAGVDITDASVKWLSLAPIKQGYRVLSYGNQPLPEGVVVMGAVKDAKALAQELIKIKKTIHDLKFAHAALPEEGAYVFSMHVPPKSTRQQIMSMIEFELEGRVPIPPAQAVYDFDTIFSRDDQGEEIAVTVFPRELAEGYVEAFSLAGVNLMSLEIEARSIARAVCAPTQDPVTLLVDCGRARTGVAILKHGIPIFTSTIEVGGDHMTHAVMEALSLSEEDAIKFKNEKGLVPGDVSEKKALEALDKVCSSLADEIGRHHRFWDTRRNESGTPTAPVERVLLVGGSANVKGFPEYVAGRVHALTERPNVWRNVVSFDEYIPPIDSRAAFQYATAIGLAQRGL